MTSPSLSRIVAPAPGSIAEADVVLKLWGDAASGQVNDLIYLSNDKLHQMIFTLPPGGWFGHSESNRTTFGADELYYVLSGVLVLSNPETGEVHRAEAGEAVYFGPATWHHGFNASTTRLRVLEYFAPPPATGSSQVYAKTRPYLEDPCFTQDEYLGGWPARAAEAAAKRTQHVIRQSEVLWRLEGADDKILTGILLSTDQLTAGQIEMMPGQRSDPRLRGGDLAGYILEGELNLFFPEDRPAGKGNGWFRMGPGDGFFVPEGTLHQYFNVSDAPARFLFGVAPSYLPGT
jgi:quercetin dioxygenase-like cupin family protein